MIARTVFNARVNCWMFLSIHLGSKVTPNFKKRSVWSFESINNQDRALIVELVDFSQTCESILHVFNCMAQPCVFLPEISHLFPADSLYNIKKCGLHFFGIHFFKNRSVGDCFGWFINLLAFSFWLWDIFTVVWKSLLNSSRLAAGWTIIFWRDLFKFA